MKRVRSRGDGDAIPTDAESANAGVIFRPDFRIATVAQIEGYFFGLNLLADYHGAREGINLGCIVEDGPAHAAIYDALIANVVKSKNAKYDYGKNEEYCDRSADDFVPPYTLMTAEPSIRDFDSNAHLETAENSLNLDDGGHLLVSPKN